MAYGFDGSNSYLELGSSLFSGEPFSVAMWFRPGSVTGAQFIAGIATSTGTTTGHALRLSGTTIQARSSVSGAGASANPGLAAAIGKWFLGVACFETSTSRIGYADAGWRATNTTSEAASGMDRTDLGCTWSSAARANFYNGLLAEVGFVRGILLPSQVRALFEGRTLPEVVPSSALVSYLPLNKDTGFEDFGALRSRWTSNAAQPVSDHPRLWVSARRRIYLVSNPSSGRTLSGALSEAKDTAAISARVTVSGSLARSEAADTQSAGASVKLTASAPLSELADSSSAQARVVAAGTIAGHEANDHSDGNIASGAPTVIDPNYLFLARPRARRVTQAARLRELRALPRIRSVIAAKRA